jgi:signal transduction histidine kinase
MNSQQDQLLQKGMAELEKQLAEKSIELQNKNRELEIESSLELVRAVAMSMRNRDDMLEICKIISHQLELLGVKEIRNVQTAIFYEEKGTYANYEFYARHMRQMVTDVEYKNHPISQTFADQMLKGANQVWTHAFRGEEIRDWLNHQKSTNVFIDTYLETADTLDYYWYSLGPVALGISTYSPLNETEINLFKRFRNVFELSYRRYLDIEKAEAQAREATIQASLEKVRAVAMGMNKSADLLDVCETMFKEFLALGFEEMRNTMINIHNDAEKKFVNYDYSDAAGKTINHLAYNIHPLVEKQVSKMRGDSDAFSETYFRGDDLVEWEKFRRQIGEKDDPRVNSVDGLCYYFYSAGNSSIGMSTFGPISEEKIALLKRFRNVFALSYQRYVDIANAEAQAREAQIQLGLERLRARTMAMHQSSELAESASVMFEQLSLLGASLWICGFNICQKDSEIVEGWISPIDGRLMQPMYVPYTVDQFSTSAYQAWRNKGEIYSDIMEGIELKKSTEELMKHPSMSTARNLLSENNIPIPDWVQRFAVPYTFGYLTIVTTKLFEEKDILTRFAKVFDQTYTRFLDLQKAEAQARESQIQLALERVRARTMAMQRSNELAETVSLLFKQLLVLGIKQTQIRTCAIVTFFSEKPIGECWITKPDGEIVPNSFEIPYNKIPTYNEIYSAWKKGEKFLVLHLAGDSLKQHQDYLKKFTKIPIRDFQGLPGQSNETYTHALFFSRGYLLIISGEPLIEYHDIFKRVGDTFQQTYTRFLDLQKAEEQAKEAQIEAALERVRSRTMAMHKSSELLETAELLFDQLKQLGAELQGVAFAICDKNSDMVQKWTSIGVFSVPYTIEPGEQRMYEAWKNQVEIYEEVYEGERLKKYYELFMEVPAFRQGIQKFIESGHSIPTWQKNHAVTFKQGYLLLITTKPFNETQIFLRFGKVFEQTYTRFLDLQKAEAQAREAKIEAALEKVRSRSIAMHHSDELEQVVGSLFDRLVELGLSLDGALIFLFDKEKRSIQLWIATTHLSAPVRIDLPYDEKMKDNTIIKDLWNAIENGEHIFNKSYPGQTKNDYFRYVSKYNESKIPESVRKLQIERDNWTVYFVAEKNSLLGFDSWSGPIAGDEYFPILTRFSKVFEQAYTRFLDLKKAELQARESQIQLALERVRARTMAMQKSDELREVVAVIYDQLLQLGFVQEGSCNINIMDADTGDVDWWMTGFGDQKYPHKFHVQRINHRAHATQLAVWKSGEKYTTIEVAGESKKEFDKLMLSQPDFEKMSEETKTTIASLDKAIFSMAFMKYGALSWAANPITDEQANILQRFARVFEQTYTRFLDLQNAEAQAREARIEAALEKVRSRSMAMHNASELKEVVKVLFEKLHELNIVRENTSVSLITTLTENTKDAWYWTATPLLDESYVSAVHVPFVENIFYSDYYHAKQNGLDYFAKVYTKTEKNEYFEYLFTKTDFKYLPPERKKMMLESEKCGMAEAFIIDGALQLNNSQGELPTEQEKNILKRFAKVFDQSYIRFLDLQTAEAQAKEATIEAALERVRSKAMSMYNSYDLSAATAVVFTELDKLGIRPIRSGVGLVSREDRKMQLYSVASTADGNSLSLMGEIVLSGHPEFDKQYERWLRKENYFTSLKGEELKSYYKILSAKLNTQLNIHNKTDEEQFGYWIMFSEGFFYTWSEKKYSDTEINILERFKNVIELTFRRYIDLKKSEANAKEAVKQAALDRIRADIASMRTIQDLDRITPLIWNELTILGIPFIRCGVFLMDDEQSLIHTFLSTPDGRAIAAFNLPYDASENIKDVVSCWHDKKNYMDHWDEKDFIEFADIIVKQGDFGSREEYLKIIPKGGFYLHFSPFLQGMLYVGNTTQLNEEEIQLIQSVADAFSTAYARYEDFNKLEAAKKQVDKTLVDLRQAQTQLVQSEKMASLGELTAGIAHEIQNPLNFVNNFSDVNTELLREMKTEIDKGNFSEVKIIADDIINNEEKISQHGKRADSIVKGMLQHSRTSTGQKESADINALADEYLRLSYHGLRAKDNSFNATMKTEFDSSIGKINIVPQDIGRVLLNIFNNAFYAVSEKKKTAGNNYEPAVTVSTKKLSDKIEIKVIDNGNGISQKVRDKIFQPFFTTKPTGQGTGLGLSLSYDIIKAHGGDIKVETREGEGTEFIVQLSNQ